MRSLEVFTIKLEACDGDVCVRLVYNSRLAWSSGRNHYVILER
ncbi:hypothetical protein P886_3707 [Alteromonadaceae bacterium 2753L.S.0a.02]|nr:hypothetical protein P886_3707 [Alteromonadaceae bacterium 2753L.S.0a.02]